MIDTCREVVELVTEYLEGGLSADRRLGFEQHVAICPPCRAHLAQFRRTLRVAGTLREEELAPEVRNELLEAFRTWRDR